MIEDPTDDSSLKDLADAIKLLYDTGTKEWTADDVISLVDELSGKNTYLLYRVLEICYQNTVIELYG